MIHPDVLDTELQDQADADRGFPTVGAGLLVLALISGGLLFLPPARLVGLALVLPLGAAVVGVWFRRRAWTTGALSVLTLAVLAVVLGVGVGMVISSRGQRSAAVPLDPPVTPTDTSDTSGPSPATFVPAPGAAPAPSAPDPGSPGSDPGSSPGSGSGSAATSPGSAAPNRHRDPDVAPPRRAHQPDAPKVQRPTGPDAASPPGHNPAATGPARQSTASQARPNAADAPRDNGTGPGSTHGANGSSNSVGSPSSTDSRDSRGSEDSVEQGANNQGSDQDADSEAAREQRAREANYCSLGQYKINNDGTADVCAGDTDSEGHTIWRRHVPPPK